MIFMLDAISGLAVLGFALLGIVIPLLSIVYTGGVSQFPIFDTDILHAAKLTALQAGVSAVVSLVIGTGLGCWVHGVAKKFETKKATSFFRVLLALPFGVPAVVAASAWIGILGRSGLHVGWIYTLTAVIVAHVFFNIPWVALWVSRALDDISPSQKQAARSLGANRFQEFWSFTLREIQSTLISVFSQVFAFCATSFILVLILGGGPPVETLETALYIHVRSGGLDLSGASACAFWQLLLTFVPWICLQKFQKRTSKKIMRGSHAPEPGARKSFALIVLGLALCLLLSPYFTLIRLDVFAHFFDLMRRSHSRVVLLKGLLSSLQISFSTAMLALFVALGGIWLDHRLRFQKFGQVIAHLMIFPSGISTMVLGLGLFVAYRSEVDPFSSSILPVVVLQSIFFIAIIFRVLRPLAAQCRQTEIEAARSLGAGWIRSFFAVEAKRWRMPVFGAFSLVLGAALGEVGAVSLFYNEDRVPLSLIISRWTSQYRFEDAQSLALILMILSLITITVGVTYDGN